MLCLGGHYPVITCGSAVVRLLGNKAKEGKHPWAPDLISCTPPVCLRQRRRYLYGDEIPPTRERTSITLSLVGRSCLLMLEVFCGSANEVASQPPVEPHLFTPAHQVLAFGAGKATWEGTPTHAPFIQQFLLPALRTWHLSSELSTHRNVCFATGNLHILSPHR
jgi:hypothetical protein